MGIADDKKQLRQDAQLLRMKLACSASNAASQIAENFFRAIPMAARSVIAGYVPIRGEADPLPLMNRLRAAGQTLALARVNGKGLPLSFHLWREGVEPVDGTFVLREAGPDWPLATPQIVLVPLLGFEAQGHRLGYGGGFYDRTLRVLRENGPVLAVGIAFSGQEMVVPHDESDERLDWIVTEKFARGFDRLSH